MRWLLDKMCSLFHHTWRIPLWNRSALLSCPVGWLCRRNARFNKWFWA